MCKIQMGKPDGNDGVIWGPWDCFWQPVLAAAHLCYQSLTHTSCRFKHLNILKQKIKHLLLIFILIYDHSIHFLGTVPYACHDDPLPEGAG